MKIVWLPRYSTDKASSRIRVWSIHLELMETRQDVLSIIGKADHPEDMYGADVLVIQKRTDEDAFLRAREVKANGGLVIYDFDDVDIMHGVMRAKSIVDLFTTDTEGHRWKTEAYWKGRPCEVIPDAIDYFPKEPLPLVASNDAVWFGSYPNYASARWMVETLRSNGVKVNVFTEMGFLIEEGGRPWNYKTFVEDMRQSGIAILSHAHPISDTHKSDNRMTMAITHGLPCLVSDTEAYGKLARDGGMDWSIVRNPYELMTAYEHLLKMEERKYYLSKMQSLVWERNSIATITDRFLSVIKAHQQRRMKVAL